jgi:hypothetical protein
MSINYDQVMTRLVADGYENCHGDGEHQIIVNNRGEIEFYLRREVPVAMIYDRLVANYGNHEEHTDLDSLMADVERTWSKKEFD